jgi:predicted nucleotidyltransferase
MREEVEPLLDRFLSGLHETLPPTAVWAHGSLALGDFQPGRSDLDMIAVVDSAPTDAQREQLKVLHEALAADFPQAEKLHCSYTVRAALPDPAVRHLTWAHQSLMTRPVTEVSRRELHTGGLTLYGPPPTELLPAVTDAELAAFIRADLRGILAARDRGARPLVAGHLGRPRPADPGPRVRHPGRRPPPHQGRGP